MREGREDRKKTKINIERGERTQEEGGKNQKKIEVRHMTEESRVETLESAPVYVYTVNFSSGADQ